MKINFLSLQWGGKKKPEKKLAGKLSINLHKRRYEDLLAERMSLKRNCLQGFWPKIAIACFDKNSNWQRVKLESLSNHPFVVLAWKIDWFEWQQFHISANCVEKLFRVSDLKALKGSLMFRAEFNKTSFSKGKLKTDT